MKQLEKYKIAPQTKFVKFRVKHFVEIPTIRHDKAVPLLLDCLKSSPPWMCPHPGSWSLAVAPPCLTDDTKIISPLISGGEDTMMQYYISMYKQPLKDKFRKFPIELTKIIKTSETCLYQCVTFWVNLKITEKSITFLWEKVANNLSFYVNQSQLQIKSLKVSDITLNPLSKMINS